MTSGHFVLQFEAVLQKKKVEELEVKRKRREDRDILRRQQEGQHHTPHPNASYYADHCFHMLDQTYSFELLQCFINYSSPFACCVIIIITTMQDAYWLFMCCRGGREGREGRQEGGGSRGRGQSGAGGCSGRGGTVQARVRTAGGC